jgi:alginate O-acetyltransferase complex protein AlgI
MVFSTYIFVFCFLPLVLLGYYALLQLAKSFRNLEEPVSRWRNRWLLLMSYVFYGWWNPWFILLMMSVTVACYLSGRIISRAGADTRRRHWGLALALISSLCPLAFFKYFTFLQVNLNIALELLGADGVRVLQIILPAGISFYSFHALSYALDVHRGTAPPARSLSDFACYIALFPQLVAGPIIRYNTVADQFVHRSHTWDKFASGSALFILGLAKKVLLANPMGKVADAAFAAQSLTAPDAWFGVVAYAFQIYFDFAGYSDMAIGLGRMIGFEFLKNFDAPYRSESITEFWRRWHISLSTLLRDYLYLPLGGNRKGPRRTYVNLAIVMLLGGLWHGAAWSFVVWGAYHGALLAFERRLGKQSPYHRLPRAARVTLTFVLVLISWVLFRAETLTDALRYLGAMLGFAEGGVGAMLLPSLLYSRGTMMLMLLCAILAFERQQAHEWCSDVTWPKALVLLPILAAALMVMFSQAFSPFLYFQF